MKNPVLAMLFSPQWSGDAAFIGGIGATLSTERGWAKLMEDQDKIIATSGPIVRGLIYSVDMLLALLAGAVASLILMSATKMIRRTMETRSRDLDGDAIDVDKDTGSLTRT